MSREAFVRFYFDAYHLVDEAAFKHAIKMFIEGARAVRYRRKIAITEELVEAKATTDWYRDMRRERLSLSFDLLELDGAIGLNQSEFEALGMAVGPEWILQGDPRASIGLDRNGDGVVSKSEFMSYYEESLLSLGISDETFEEGLRRLNKAAKRIHIAKIKRLENERDAALEDGLLNLEIIREKEEEVIRSLFFLCFLLISKVAKLRARTRRRRRRLIP